jgi:amicyanin
MNKKSGITLAILAIAIIVIGGLFMYTRSSSDDKSDANSTSSDSSTDQKAASDDSATSAQESETQNSGNSNQTTTPATQGAKAVTIDDMAFSPKEITVKVGATVTWTNQDTVSHDVTDDNDSADGPNSELLGQGESYSFTFKKAGTYNYHCSPHPFMKATVIVTE